MEKYIQCKTLMKWEASYIDKGSVFQKVKISYICTKKITDQYGNPQKIVTDQI